MSETLTPGKLTDRLKDKIDLDGKITGQLGTELFSIIARELKTEESLSLFGFGSFKRIPVPISKGRNPHTGEEIIIPAHFRIKFTPSSKVAERINAEYANLKPVILEEEKKHEGLLLKAERYVLSVKADPQPPLETFPESPSGTEPEETGIERRQTDEILPTAVSPEKYAESSKTETQEPDFGFEKDRKISAQRRNLILMGGLLLLIGLGWIILDRSRGDEVTSISVSRETPETLQKEAESVATFPEVEEAGPVTIPPAETQASPPQPAEEAETDYSILSGDSFSLLARDRWGSIHLWPYLYSWNRDRFPDPDLIRPGDRIVFPPEPDREKDRDKIEGSILMAYQRYRDLITAQAGSPRNPNREISSGYVLIGGETLYPGFLKRHEGRVRTEDIRRAENLLP